MAIKNHKGFALIIAIIFLTVVLTLSVTLSSLGYKQQILSMNAMRSQYAFYAADALLECALIDGNKSAGQDPYSYINGPYDGSPAATCGQYAWESAGQFPLEDCKDLPACPNQRISKKLFEIAYEDPQADGEIIDKGKLCAELTVYEYPNKPALSTYMFAQGFDVPCQMVKEFRAGNLPNARIVTQGLSVRL